MQAEPSTKRIPQLNTLSTGCYHGVTTVIQRSVHVQSNPPASEQGRQHVQQLREQQQQ